MTNKESLTTRLVSITIAVGAIIVAGGISPSFATTQCTNLDETSLDKIIRWVSDDTNYTYERCLSAKLAEDEREAQDAKYFGLQSDTDFRNSNSEQLMYSHANANNFGPSSSGLSGSPTYSIINKDPAKKSKQIETLKGYTTAYP